MSLRARALDFFIEPAPPRGRAAAPSDAGSGLRAGVAPAEAPPAAGSRSMRAAARSYAPPRAAAGARYATAVATPRSRAATRMPLRAAVLGSAAEAVPLGALLANALRAAVGASTAALAVWAPGAVATRGGPSTLSASRLAARLSARGLPAVARGRLAWLAPDDHPVAATVAVRRAAGALEVPLVVVLCGPRCEVVEGLLAEQDLVVVAASEPDGPLARLAVQSCATAALACAPPPPGPVRWLARSGTGARGLPPSLRDLVGELTAPPVVEPTGVAW
jgi:hypothetical protein